nr:PREDICTED: BTB/POZ domain-containing protein KCTD19 isoform X3 [Latimeria chalumnae]|eukprot:XP_014351353.1 PREDICTED: BTB/POZ domain-containing protein KCTD19 isoform X3 [Latimeria chalumnae]
MANELPSETRAFYFNVGGWLFSVPKVRLAQFQDSVLWREASSSLTQSADSRLFIDRDGWAFRYVHYYLHTSRVSSSSISVLDLLYEQAASLQLSSLLQALDGLKEGKHNLRVRPMDVPIAETASVNYWKARKCNSKLSEFSVKSPQFTGIQDKAPLGLIDTPLLDTDEEIHYCFLSLELVKKYPALLNSDNLLWICEDVILLECGSSEFRFIANFLRSGKILLPDRFPDIDALTSEAEFLGIPELINAVKTYRSSYGNKSSVFYSPDCSVQDLNLSSTPHISLKPLYILILELLVKYPDSALGQLHIESNLDGSKLYIAGNGVLFKHARNWLGTCKLPLTEDVTQIYELCVYMDKVDATYQPMKDAIRTYLRIRRQQTQKKIIYFASGYLEEEWTATVKNCSLHQIVKIYVGSYWYATYLKTLLKYQELLSNSKKVWWITFGQSLFISGDGLMFQHILNFLRLDKLLISSEFKEWPLLCQEIEEYKIPALSDALYQCEAYRTWLKKNEAENEAFFSSGRTHILEEDGEESKKAKQEEQFIFTSEKCNSISSGKTDTQAIPDKISETYSRTVSSTKARKRTPNSRFVKHKLSDSYNNSSGALESCSPTSPKKRATNQVFQKETESKATSSTPIQKLISLVQGWDMVSTQDCKAPVIPTDSNTPTEICSEACLDFNLEQSTMLPETVRLQAQKIKNNIEGSTSNHSNRKALECLLSRFCSTQQLVINTGEKGHDSSRIDSRGLQDSLKQRLCRDKDPSHMCKEAFLLNEKILSTFEETSSYSAGLILKVEHPPVLGNDSSCDFFTESVIYTVESAATACTKIINPHERTQLKSVVFLSFNLSHEEMFYARECHYFLTNIILDSQRLKDPKEFTMKIASLTLQVSSEKFVEDLLSVKPFKNEKHVHKQLLRWLKLTLPFAWKYSQCIEILMKKGLSFLHVREEYMENFSTESVNVCRKR